MPTVTKAANAHTTVTTGWTSPANAYATTGDDVYATAAPAKNATINGDFGFPAFTSSDIPAGSTVNSVTVTVEWGMTAAVTGGTLGVQLHNPAGTALGTETTQTTTTEVQATQVVTSGITLTDLGTANVVVARTRCSKGNTNTAMTGNLDFISLTVDYSPAGRAQPTRRVLQAVNRAATY